MKERKFQIPGLQTSSYLKVYVLRCDDKDSYKANERAKLREWIRENAVPNKKGKSENHDAFQWLILQVVIPDTVAASEPRWRVSQRDSEELRERKGGTKLPGKSTRTVFDKLRTDFNESGKNAQEHVAQIRLQRDEIPADFLLTPAVAATLGETIEEREQAWNDLMTKFKILILDSFDKRVKQYETDVAEQESRRSMPGFNFCTFFIHKEGLAKALESIGLVEDALVIYDELSLGLETVLRDVASGKAEGTATTFAPYTEDVRERIVGLSKARTNGANGNDTNAPTEKLEMQEQDYRERIVRSNISVFDFVSYLFSRQKALFLRIANARNARADLGSGFKDGGEEDLVLISEVCWRATSFVHNNARTLRQDLLAYRRAQWEKKAEKTMPDADIESLVCCWTYTVAGQILDDTASSALDDTTDPGRREGLMNGALASLRQRPESVSLGISAHPHRTASLPARKSRVSELQGRESLQSASESDLMSPPSTPGSDGRRSMGALPGLVELVTYRAELVMMRRKMLELVAKQRGWRAGWASIREARGKRMEDVDLNGDVEPPVDDTAKITETQASTLLTPALAAALESQQSFHSAYESLSDTAMRLFVLATQSKTAESIMGDLAILKFQQGDFGYATSYFEHVLPLYKEETWGLMEAEALRMQAKSLKELGKGAEYVKCVLQLLTRSCEGKGNGKTLDEKFGEVEGMLNEVIDFSANMDEHIESPAEPFFADIRLEQEVMHRDDRDGFSLRLRLRSLLDDSIKLDHVSAKLVQVDDPLQEVWFASTAALNLRPGRNVVDLETNTVVFGAYLVNEIVIKAMKLCFVHEIQPTTEPEQTPFGITTLEKSDTPPVNHKRPWVFLYPASQAFGADIQLERHIRIDKPRHLEIKLCTGWNDVQSVDLKLKPGSAGLRLHLADASSSLIAPKDDEGGTPGQITLGSLTSGATAFVRVPYSLEQASQEIFVRLEARYRTSNGIFTFMTAFKLPTELPLDVDVNDVFHLDALFSNFTVRTTKRIPLSIAEATLGGSAIYDVEAPPVLPMPMTVFERQPIKLVYKITKRAEIDRSVAKSDATLALSVYYYSVDEIIIEKLRHTFGDSLEKGGFASLSQLLLPLLAMRSKQLLSSADSEMAVLLNEAKVPSFEEIGWPEIVNTLPTGIQQELIDWLRKWHDEHGYVSFAPDGTVPRTPRCITISVDVPSVDFVHKVSIGLLGQQKYAEHDLQILALGQSFKAQMKITSTRSWSMKCISVTKDDEGEDDHSFVYDIQADPDSWLIGGQRRTRFSAKDGVELTFDLLLIPLRLGTYSLPNVDVQAVRVSGNTDTNNNEVEPSAVSCETHCESAGPALQVIRDLRSARVQIPEWPASARPPS